MRGADGVGERQARSAGQDVVADGAAKQEVLLQHDAKVAPEVAEVDVAQIDAVKTRADLVRLMGQWAAFVDMPMGLAVAPDAKDPTIYSASTGQGGLGIGDRD